MIKDNVVHLTGSKEDEVRLAFAETISERFEAHLTGIFVHMLPEVTGVEGAAVAGMESWFAESAATARHTFERLQKRLDRFTMPHDVRQIDALSGTAGAALTAEARTADLFITTRPYGDPADEVHMEVSVLFGSGRACLFVPPKAHAPRAFGTVVVAWNGSREAARAVAEAMPFLRQASQVIIVTVREDDRAEPSELARHLSRHGISAVAGTVDASVDGAGKAILEEVSRVGADLLVMGGYGRPRLLEWVFGGATRHVLSHAQISVLMAR